MNDTWDEKGDVISQGAWWFTRILGDENWTAAEEKAFDRWIGNPAHLEELAAQFRMHERFLDAAPQLGPSIRAQVQRHRRQRAFAGRLALAASVFAALGLTVWLAKRPHDVGATSYATHTGETRKVHLADGSVAELNTRTRLEWTGRGADRSAVLHEGEVLFKVRHDAAHPFRVRVDRSEIQVLGTEFDVYRKRNGDVAVTVLSGAVEVRDLNSKSASWKQVVRANERLVYQPHTLKRELESTEAASAARWREGVLEIANTPLGDALEELGRYTDQRIVAADPRLAHVVVVATVTTRNARAALARLEQLAPITVTESQGTFTLTYRDPKEFNVSP